MFTHEMFYILIKSFVLTTDVSHTGLFDTFIKKNLPFLCETIILINSLIILLPLAIPSLFFLFHKHFLTACFFMYYFVLSLFFPLQRLNVRTQFELPSPVSVPSSRRVSRVLVQTLAQKWAGRHGEARK